MPVARKPCKRCGRNRALRFYGSPRATVCSDCRRRGSSGRSRAARLDSTYGISMGEYEALLAAQGGVCAICGGKRSYNLDVDHDHAVERASLDAGTPPREAARGSIRGLLCKTCNRGILRKARDRASVLRAAADYLDRGVTHAQEVLG